MVRVSLAGLGWLAGRSVAAGLSLASRLIGVHDGADDSRARVSQVAEGTLGARDLRMILAHHQQRVAGAEGDAGRVGVFRYRGRVYQDRVVLRLRLGEERGEARARQQL